MQEKIRTSRLTNVPYQVASSSELLLLMLSSYRRLDLLTLLGFVAGHECERKFSMYRKRF